MKNFYTKMFFKFYLVIINKLLKLAMNSSVDDAYHAKLIEFCGIYIDDFANKSNNKEYRLEGAAYTSFNILSKYASAGNALKASSSQCGEDVILKHIFDNRRIKNPTYLDIGAHHPYILSNTAIFYASGSRGINIEPNPMLFKEFLKLRPEDTNIQAAISDKRGYAELCIPKSSSALASLIKDNNSQEELKVIKVKTLNLKDLLKQYMCDRMPDFMSIDIEGMDEEVINQLATIGQHPKAICLETVEYSPRGDGGKRESLIDAVQALGYFIFADTNINTIFVQRSFWYGS